MRLVIACWDNTLDEREGQVRDVATGQPVGVPLRHSDGVLDVTPGEENRFLQICRDLAETGPSQRGADQSS